MRYENQKSASAARRACCALSRGNMNYTSHLMRVRSRFAASQYLLPQYANPLGSICVLSSHEILSFFRDHGSTEEEQLAKEAYLSGSWGQVQSRCVSAHFSMMPVPVAFSRIESVGYMLVSPQSYTSLFVRPNRSSFARSLLITNS